MKLSEVFPELGLWWLILLLEVVQSLWKHSELGQTFLQAI
jgi:hypothetical protein